jgi:tetratricopeptide (TPR) repeat protein
MRPLFVVFFLTLQLLTLSVRAQDTTVLHRQRTLLLTLPEAGRRVRVLDSLCYALHETAIPQALAYGEQGVALARRLGDQPGLMHCLLSLGSCYASSSDGPHALALYNEAHALARRLNSAEGLVRSYSSMAGIHHERGDTTIAWRNYKEALRLVNRPGVTEHTQIILYGNLSSFFFYLTRHDQALRYMHRALYLARRNHDRSAEALYLANLGTYYWQKGRLEIAEGLLRQALEISQQLREVRYEAGHLELLSLVLLQTHRTDEAADYAAQALRKARQSKYLERVLDAYSVLAQVNTQQQNYKQAYQWQERFLALNDTLNNRQRLNTLMALQTRYDLRDKEHQIRLLTERTHVQQLRNQSLWALVAFLVVLVVGVGLLYWQLRRNRAALRDKNSALRETTAELRRMAASKDRLYAIVAHAGPAVGPQPERAARQPAELGCKPDRGAGVPPRAAQRGRAVCRKCPALPDHRRSQADQLRNHPCSGPAPLGRPQHDPHYSAQPGGQRAEVYPARRPHPVSRRRQPRHRHRHAHHCRLRPRHAGSTGRRSALLPGIAPGRRTNPRPPGRHRARAAAVPGFCAAAGRPAQHSQHRGGRHYGARATAGAPGVAQDCPVIFLEGMMRCPPASYLYFLSDIRCFRVQSYC